MPAPVVAHTGNCSYWLHEACVSPDIQSTKRLNSEPLDQGDNWISILKEVTELKLLPNEIAHWNLLTIITDEEKRSPNLKGST